MSDFSAKRRQQFITSRYAGLQLARREKMKSALESELNVPDIDTEDVSLLRATGADNPFEWLLLHYTAGDPIEPLRAQLGEVIEAYEHYQEALGVFEDTPLIAPLGLDRLDDFERCLQLIGLCYLLHRRDLLPRIAKLEDPGYAGEDTLYEDLLAHELEGRFEVDSWYHDAPYRDLVNSLYRDTPAESLSDLQKYLKAWYPAFKTVPWHDGHLRMTETDGDYYGYWAFEAGAVAYLLDLDDSSITHMVYPKDLVAWARAHKHLSEDAAGTTTSSNATRLRCEAGEPCLRTGHWFTPAQANSRREFQAGELMPSVGGDYGLTIWQWDERQ
jgi:hypothetical protein